MSKAAELLAQAKSRTSSSRVRPKAQSLADDATTPPKVFAWGHTGTGKSYLIVGMLLAGEKVFVTSSDFGTNGLSTVKNELKRIGRLDLAKNVRFIDLATYDDIHDFFENPLEFVPDLDTWEPTVQVWEGFASFNIDILDEYILNHAPGAENSGELRHAGFTHTKQDWQGMKRGTVRCLRKFLSFQLPSGRPMARVLTCLEAGSADSFDFTGKASKGPLVHGTGKQLLGPAFDVIMQMYKEKGADGKLKFYYRCDGESDKYLLKSRGYNLKPVEDAEPERVWRIIRETGGQAATKEISE